MSLHMKWRGQYSFLAKELAPLLPPLVLVYIIESQNSNDWTNIMSYYSQRVSSCESLAGKIGEKRHSKSSRRGVLDGVESSNVVTSTVVGGGAKVIWSGIGGAMKSSSVLLKKVLFFNNNYKEHIYL